MKKKLFFNQIFAEIKKMYYFTIFQDFCHPFLKELLPLFEKSPTFRVISFIQHLSFQMFTQILKIFNFAENFFENFSYEDIKNSHFFV
jgi:hypothetical protein